MSTPMRRSKLDRRKFLLGTGVTFAIPTLSSMETCSVRAGETALQAGGKPPTRMAFMSIPNGVQQKHWFPSGEGHSYEFNSTMQPLQPLKDQLQVISGLNHEEATAGNDGGGDHARANATFLTGARARKTSGKDIRVGVSIDQAAAQALGQATRFPSLELSSDAVRNTGACDTGYACAYQYNLSWSAPSTPVTPEPNPRFVFERLFGTGEHGERAKNLSERLESQRSLLDFVLEDARDARKLLSGSDRRKLDEYFESVRSIEKRIASAERLGAAPDPDVDTPVGIPQDFGAHMDVMYDLLALAFQTDSARIATLLLAHDGSNRSFPDLGITEGHHHLTHNQKDPELAAKVAKIDQYYMRHFARFLKVLSDTKESDGSSLLDNSMIVYGGAISDGNRHYHDNLPVILAGRGGGRIETGRHLQLEKTPMSNLFVTMLREFGVQTDRFGDSNGNLDNQLLTT